MISASTQMSLTVRRTVLSSFMPSVSLTMLTLTITIRPMKICAAIVPRITE